MKHSADAYSTVTVLVKRILVAVDRSEYKEKIVAYALSLTKAWGAEITAIHIVEPGQALQDGGRAQTLEQTRKNKSISQAENLLNEIDTLAKRQGMSVKKEAIRPSDLLTQKKSVNVKKEALEESDIVGKTIIEYAKINNVDVIVIGTKGMSAVEEYFFGSVANKVIHDAHCPVFAIH
jgi:nucleotide-binding universal stress UspA family protein